MAAIKHIRSAELQLLELERTMDMAASEAVKEHQYLLREVMNRFRVQVGELRDRLVQVKIAQELTEAEDPRNNPYRPYEQVAVDFSLDSPLKPTLLCRAYIPCHDLEAAKEVMDRIQRAVDGHSKIGEAVRGIQHLKPFQPVPVVGA